jgi:hypothetical protein
MKFTFGRALVNGLLYFIIYHVQKSEALILAVDGEGLLAARWSPADGC